MLDKYRIDWPAFLTARINSFVEFHQEPPDRLTILQRRSLYVSQKRIAELEYIFRQLREAA